MLVHLLSNHLQLVGYVMHCARVWGHTKQSDMVPTCPGDAQLGAVALLLGNQGAKVILGLGFNLLAPM